MLADSVASKQIEQMVSTVLAQPELEDAAERSCVVAEIVTPSVTGRPILAFAPDRAVIPASTLKMFTASAALAMFDPGERFRTTVRSTVAASGGQLAGDLWLVGGGDPLLESAKYTKTRRHPPDTATSLDKLADDVVAAGITTITGRIVGDDRLFDEQRVLPSWKKSYVSQGEVGPIGGLIIDDNFTRLDAKGRPIAATDVPTNAAQAFQRMLEERGVVVDGEAGAADRRSPDAATAAPVVVATIDSVTVEKVVAQMLRESDNMTAEALLKHVGVRASGNGSTQAGAAAVGRTLWARGAASASRDVLRMVDGSGLDRGDRASCAALVDVLRASPQDGELIQGLAVMGESGTLKTRLKDTPAAGKVHAKTGTLNGVSALTGTAATTDGRFVRFAMVLNGLASTDYGVKLGNDLSVAFVDFGKSVNTAAMEPKA